MAAAVPMMGGELAISLTDQSLSFLLACALGGALGVLYDLFRISRRAFVLPGFVIAIQDLAFFLICAFVSFGYLMNATDGRLRFFIVVGELLGWVLYYFTVGCLIMKAADAVLAVIRRILRLFWRLTGAPLLRLLRRLGSFLKKFTQWTANLMKKTLQKPKNRLKTRQTLLYNYYVARCGKSRKKRRVRQWRSGKSAGGV